VLGGYLSRFDFETFSRAANQFRYLRLAATFATNSIKLYSSATSGKRVPYIWIDSPWQLLRNHKLFIESASYPNPFRAGGRHQEKLWLQQAGTFGKHYFLGCGLTHDNLVAFRFSDGWTILASGWETPRDEEQWYDDWYAKGPRDAP
jgi:hypothetical protein